MPETPEITRRRNASIRRNEQWREAHGFGTSRATAPASTTGGAGMFAGVAVGVKRKLASSTASSCDLPLGGVDHRDRLRPLSALVKDWPGRAEQIRDLAGLIGEVSGGVLPLLASRVTVRPRQVHVICCLFPSCTGRHIIRVSIREL